MTLTSLLIESDKPIREAIEKQFKNFLESSQNEEDEEEKERRYLRKIIEGIDEDTSAPKNKIFIPNVDLEKYVKELKLVFPLCHVDYIMEATQKIKGYEVMVVSVNRKEFDCIYDVEKFKEIEQYLEQKELLT